MNKTIPDIIGDNEDSLPSLVEDSDAISHCEL